MAPQVTPDKIFSSGKFQVDASGEGLPKYGIKNERDDIRLEKAADLVKYQSVFDRVASNDIRAGDIVVIRYANDGSARTGRAEIVREANYNGGSLVSVKAEGVHANGVGLKDITYLFRQAEYDSGSRSYLRATSGEANRPGPIEIVVLRMKETNGPVARKTSGSTSSPSSDMPRDRPPLVPQPAAVTSTTIPEATLAPKTESLRTPRAEDLPNPQSVPAPPPVVGDAASAAKAANSTGLSEGVVLPTGATSKPNANGSPLGAIDKAVAVEVSSDLPTLNQAKRERDFFLKLAKKLSQESPSDAPKIHSLIASQQREIKTAARHSRTEHYNKLLVSNTELNVLLGETTTKLGIPPTQLPPLSDEPYHTGLKRFALWTSSGAIVAGIVGLFVHKPEDTSR